MPMQRVLRNKGPVAAGKSYPPRWNITIAKVIELAERATKNVDMMEDGERKRKCLAFLCSIEGFMKYIAFSLSSKQLWFLCNLANEDARKHLVLSVPWHEVSVPSPKAGVETEYAP